MGLFDQVVGAVANAASQTGDSGNPLVSGLLQLVTNPEAGGLAGLVQSFRNGGLAEVVNSWVSTGHNLPVSAEQIRSVLGSDQVRHLANQLGIDPDQAAGQIAEYLPQLVDRLTPDGTLPETGDPMAQGLDMLKGKLFG